MERSVITNPEGAFISHTILSTRRYRSHLAVQLSKGATQGQIQVFIIVVGVTAESNAWIDRRDGRCGGHRDPKLSQGHPCGPYVMLGNTLARLVIYPAWGHFKKRGVGQEW